MITLHIHENDSHYQRERNVFSTDTHSAFTFYNVVHRSRDHEYVKNEKLGCLHQARLLTL